MELSQAASYFDKTYLDIYDNVNELWLNKEVIGQLKLSDDFISIFNRPTRRRMLFVSPTEYDKMKNFSLLRENDTGFLYLFGEPQYDILETAYRTTIPLHKVALQTTVTRRATIGPGNDPGVLLNTTLPAVYADIELRTISDDGETDNSIHSKHFMWFPSDSDVIKGDKLVFDEVDYKVLTTYKDIGFLGARVTDEPDSREDFTYRQRTGDPTFNSSAGTYTPNYTNFFISAELEGLQEDSESGSITKDKLYTIQIEYKAIGFTPNIGDAMILDSKDRVIIKIDREKHLESWGVTLR